MTTVTHAPRMHFLLMPILPPSVTGIQRSNQQRLGNGIVSGLSLREITDATNLFLHDALDPFETNNDFDHDLYSAGYVTFDVSSFFLADGKYPNGIDAFFFCNSRINLFFCPITVFVGVGKQNKRTNDIFPCFCSWLCPWHISCWQNPSLSLSFEEECRNVRPLAQHNLHQRSVSNMLRSNQCAPMQQCC